MDGAGKRVVVYGLGPLGGSLAGCCRSRGLASEVVGCDSDGANLELARRLGLVDRIEVDPVRAALGAQQVVVAVPLYEVFSLVTTIAKHLRPDALLLDVTGTTRRLRQQITRVHAAGERLVAGYPLVDIGGRGAGAARPDLLDGASMLISSGSDQELVPHLESARRFWLALGMQPLPLDPGVFERAVAACSTTPGVVLSRLKVVLDKIGVPFDYSNTYMGAIVSLARSGSDASPRARQLRAGQLVEQLRLLIEELEHELKELGAEAEGREDSHG